jgi:choline dehydrogenase-like flavoprotein
MPYYDLARGGWSALQRKGERFDSLAIMYQVEQAPDPNNRVTLSSQLDAHGCPRAEVHWRFGAADRERMNRGRQLIGEALERAGIGRVERAGTRLFSPSTHHHMGTTRAAHDPEAGVVDADLRVHGTENVYVAGSSVFPTGSYANPTLTIVALSLRLGAHLRAQLNGRRAQEARQRAASLLASGRPQAPITRAESMRSAR